jgi:hypothetical protein
MVALRLVPHESAFAVRPARNLSNKRKPKAWPHAADTPPMSPLSSALTTVSLPSTQYSGLAALTTSSQQLSQDAQQIASPATENLTNPLLNSSQSLLLTEAGAEVVRTSNQMIGALLNVFA